VGWFRWPLSRWVGFIVTDEVKLRQIADVLLHLTRAVMEVRAMVIALSLNNSTGMHKNIEESVNTVADILNEINALVEDK
jgi:hypothetical protein